MNSEHNPIEAYPHWWRLLFGRVVPASVSPPDR
jgi:hypothetical protein